MSPAIFAHGHLRLYLLSLLAERSMYGYELIQALSDRFGGTYVPSAGTIYPRLAKLEEDGLVTKKSSGRTTTYKITAAGREELAARESELDGIETELSDSVRRLADEVRSSVNEAMRTLRIDLAAAAKKAREEARSAGRTARAGLFGDERSASEPPSPEPELRVEVDVDLSSQLHEAADRMQQTGQLLHEMEGLIGEFRGRLFSDLREPLQDGRLEPDIVDVLRSGLAEVNRQVADAIRGRRSETRR